MDGCTLAEFFHFFGVFLLLPIAAIVLSWTLFKVIQLSFRWRHTRRFPRRELRPLGTVLGLVVLFYAEEDWRGWHAWNTFKQQWEARGEKFDYASFIPPPVPDNQNFALTPIVASCYSQLLDKNGHRLIPANTNIVDRLEMSIYPNYDFEGAPTNGDWEKGQTTDLIQWQAYYRTPRPHLVDKYQPPNEFENAPQPQSPAEDVLLALSKFDSTLGELRHAGELPCSRFPINYDCNPPGYFLLPHLHSLRNCLEILGLRATAELELGRTDQALADVKLGLQLADSIHNEPILISQLARAQILRLALQPVADGLVRHQWSDADLVKLDAELKKLDLLTDMQLALRGERAAMLTFIENFRSPRNYRAYAWYGTGLFFQWNWGTLSGAAVFHLIPDGWIYKLELGIAKTNQLWTLQVADPTNHLAFPKKAIDIGDSGYMLRPWWLFLPNATFGRSEPPERRIIYIQESVDLARVACALERRRLAQGDYPESLGELSPRFIATVPHDIIGGQPLHYHRTDRGGYVLYSVGWNEKDDGGEFPKGGEDRQLDLGTGDWVWPSPGK